jgi:hypothetical protein
LVHDIFWEEDAKHILATPTKQGVVDTLAWHFDTKSVFSVKSAYHVLEDSRESEQYIHHGEASTASANDESLQWPSLWRFRCQPKIKPFHGAVPTKDKIVSMEACS